METFKFGAVTDHCFQSLENKICEIFHSRLVPSPGERERRSE